MELPAGSRRPSSFGALLRGHRVAAGLSQEALAERAMLTERGVRYLERDLRRPYPDTLRRLAAALDLEPSDAAVLLGAARRPPAPASLEAGTLGAVGLPAPPTPLIGREPEATAMAALLCRAEIRMLTLTGPGGVGKTRLAVRVAEQTLSAFRDGVVWVPLAALSNAELVPTAIAQALGVSETGARPLPVSLAAALRDRQALLLLDNFEQVAAAAPLLADLVAACPRLTVLVTSRAALRLRAERVVHVAPLTPPDPEGILSLDALAANPVILRPIMLIAFTAKGRQGFTAKGRHEFTAKGRRQ
jgi:transcriptional regulator with XRE-family HTH domain